MRYLLIPIKELTTAKQRLSPVLGPAERLSLATAMMRRTLEIAARVRLADRIAVVTSYPPAVALARSGGLEIIVEAKQISESESVDFGSREAMRRGATAVLRIPIDLPLLTADDIDAILAADDGQKQAILVPSRDGTGTNAILRRPPDIFPSRFGPDSFNKHCAGAREAGIPCRIIENPNIAFDVDDPEDLEVCRRAGIL
ncbi:MAG: 2-phospho-L-lactate guanylyltransferase [Blastocatellia bacterium]|jgi:2-phospho-L-lactate guanylyltransferase